MLAALIVFLPLVGAIVAGLFGQRLGARAVNLVTCGLVLVATGLALLIAANIGLGHVKQTVTLLPWLDVGGFKADWSIRLDSLTAIMLVVVTMVSSMVHLYSVGYMVDDPGRTRFMSYLSLFTFAMLVLVTADNFVQMFFGWEGVGLASYLLIGFWYRNLGPIKASLKAFVVNRVGDFGFALGIFTVWLIFGSVEFTSVFDQVGDKAGVTFTFLGFELDALTLACLLLFVGAVGKSAQLGLHTWLPDAMEGPTPVSALIHAATMVTAGVFMLCRIAPLLEGAPAAAEVIVIFGALTALVAATIGFTQHDIKRVIAYSTMSQLGYMVAAAGVGAYGAAMFHLLTHAFFKALLFLGAGAVIYALHHEQDMRRMGGLRRVLPQTHALMLLGTLALAGIGIPGVFGLAGFYSKDIILESFWAKGDASGTVALVLGLLVALLTAFYSMRLMVLTFYGSYRGDHHTLEHAHEPPKVMLFPLFVLVVGAIFTGFALEPYFVGYDQGAFWNGLFPHTTTELIEHAHHAPLWLKWAPLVLALLGIAGAWLVYRARPGIARQAGQDFGGLFNFFQRKWYFDEIYEAVFVRPTGWLARVLWQRGDVEGIDRLGPNGVSYVARLAGQVTSRLQTGLIYNYALVMLLGIVGVLTWYLAR